MQCTKHYLCSAEKLPSQRRKILDAWTTDFIITYFIIIITDFINSQKRGLSVCVWFCCTNENSIAWFSLIHFKQSLSGAKFQKSVLWSFPYHYPHLHTQIQPSTQCTKYFFQLSHLAVHLKAFCVKHLIKPFLLSGSNTCYAESPVLAQKKKGTLQRDHELREKHGILNFFFLQNLSFYIQNCFSDHMSN